MIVLQLLVLCLLETVITTNSLLVSKLSSFDNNVIGFKRRITPSLKMSTNVDMEMNDVKVPTSSSKQISKIKDIDFSLGPKSHKVVAITSNTTLSYFRRKPEHKSVGWIEILEKLNQKLTWEHLNDKYDIPSPDIGPLAMTVLCAENESAKASLSLMGSTMSSPPVVILGRKPINLFLLLFFYISNGLSCLLYLHIVGLTQSDPQLLSLLQTVCTQAKAVSAYDCHPDYMSLQKYGSYSTPHIVTPQDESVSEEVNVIAQLREAVRPLMATLLGQAEEFTREKADRKCADIALDMWTRESIEDLLFMVMVLIDRYAYKIRYDLYINYQY